MTPQARSFIAARALPSGALAGEQLARVAARRAFVEMKQVFMRAAADVGGTVGELLQRRVRAANEPLELYQLRAVLIASLPSQHERTPLHRLELHRQLDSIFPPDNKSTTVMPL